MTSHKTGTRERWGPRQALTCSTARSNTPGWATTSPGSAQGASLGAG